MQGMWGMGGNVIFWGISPNIPGNVARLTVRISFIVGLSTCGCGYVNGTLFVSTGELSYIVKYSFRLWYHNSFGNFTGIQKNILWLGWVIA